MGSFLLLLAPPFPSGSREANVSEVFSGILNAMEHLVRILPITTLGLHLAS